MSVPVCNTANKYINMPLSYSRKSIMTSFHHEFRHAKQHDITYNYSPIEYLKNLNYITPKKMAIVHDWLTNMGVEHQELQQEHSHVHHDDDDDDLGKGAQDRPHVAFRAQLQEDAENIERQDGDDETGDDHLDDLPEIVHRLV